MTKKIDNVQSTAPLSVSSEKSVSDRVLREEFGPPVQAIPTMYSSPPSRSVDELESELDSNRERS